VAWATLSIAHGEPGVARVAGVFQPTAGDPETFAIDDCREPGSTSACQCPSRHKTKLSRPAGAEPGKVGYAMIDVICVSTIALGRQIGVLSGRRGDRSRKSAFQIGKAIANDGWQVH